MSALLLSALAAGSSGQGAPYVDDVFSTYLYTGNGAAQNINGLNLADNAGLVWLKNRTSAGDHYLFDTVRGALNELNSNNTEASASLAGSLTAFLNNGFSVGNSAAINQSSQNYVGWQFRRAPKFFDVVTYTGNGTSNRQITHSLGAQVGFAIVKATSTTGGWNVFHRSATGDLVLNTTAAQTGSKAIVNAADAGTFTVSGVANTNGVTYVAYLFAHDPSADGIIQCGSYVGNATVTLGWEPQFILKKRVDDLGSWDIHDSMRGLNVTGYAFLSPNSSNAEASGTPSYVTPTSTGFIESGAASGATYIYLAIHRQNKPPTSGAQVFAPVIGNNVTSSGIAYSTSFTVDSTWAKARAGQGAYPSSRPTGGDKYLNTSSSAAEDLSPSFSYATQTGFYTTSTRDESGRVGWCFRRAPGFFDVVCDTGTEATHAIAHNLTKAPDLIIRKSRSAATQWEVWHSALAATEKLVLNSDSAKATDATAWGSTLPTATQFTVGTGSNVNANAATFVTYLFATLAGISKVGSYTGNGSSQTIDCGFSTGARLILIKRTDATGDWYVWDTVRGIVAANDPHLSLNTTAAEVTTDDSVDPDASGFIVNQNTATNINVNGGSYIFLAIA